MNDETQHLIDELILAVEQRCHELAKADAAADKLSELSGIIQTLSERIAGTSK